VRCYAASRSRGIALTGNVPKPLATEQLELLREVLEHQGPEHAYLAAKAASNTLDRNERLRLCEMIGAELGSTGLGADSEPTARGLRLERLLDSINRPNLSTQEKPSKGAKPR